MRIDKLTAEEAAQSGWTHRFALTHADLTETADNTAQSVALMALNFGDIVGVNVLAQVVTAFSGGAVATCTVSVGVTGALTSFINAQSVMAAAKTCYVPANTVTDYPTPSGGKTLYATFTPDASHALAALTAGELHIYTRINPIESRLYS